MLSGIIDSFAEFNFGRVLLHPVTWMLTATGSLLLIGFWFWQDYKEKKISGNEYLIQFEDLAVSDSPDWVPANWSDLAFRDSRLNEVSILQNDAAEKVAAAYEVQPWIKRVRRVQKQLGDIKVDVEFRTPVGMVEVGANNLIPVDSEAVVFDGKYFPREMTAGYIRISIPLPAEGPAISGRPWKDARIVGAAAIASELEGVWSEFDLIRIVNRTRMQSRDSNQQLESFELWSRNDVPVIWGSPPGQEIEFEGIIER